MTVDLIEVKSKKWLPGPGNQGKEGNEEKLFKQT